MRLFRRRSKRRDDGASSLCKRVTIESPQRVSDDAGGYSVTWNAVATVWAHVEARNGREVFQDDQFLPRIRYRVLVRYRNDVTADMRVLYGGTALIIRSVLEDRRHEGVLALLCEYHG